MKINLQILILACLVLGIPGWIRFRYPLSRRNYLQQTAMEMLQNCGKNPEELCGVCGEGPNELPTELISLTDYQLVNVSDGPMDVGLGFRMNMNGFFEIRLCNIGPNAVANAEYCRKVVPLRISNAYQYIPGPEDTSARLRITLPPEAACEKCVLQVKYIPGIESRLAGQIFFDCALLRIPPSPTNLRMAGRILLTTDSPMKTTPSGSPFSGTSDVGDLTGTMTGTPTNNIGFSVSSSVAGYDASGTTRIMSGRATENIGSFETSTVTDSAGIWSGTGTDNSRLSATSAVEGSNAFRTAEMLPGTATDSSGFSAVSGQSQPQASKSATFLSGRATDSSGFSASPIRSTEDASRFTDPPLSASDSSKLSGFNARAVTGVSTFDKIRTTVPSSFLFGDSTSPSTSAAFSAGSNFGSAFDNEIIASPTTTAQSILQRGTRIRNRLIGNKRQSTVFDNVLTSKTRFSDRRRNRKLGDFLGDRNIKHDALTRMSNVKTGQEVAMVQLPIGITQNVSEVRMPVEEVTSSYSWDSAISVSNSNPVDVNVNRTFGTVPETSTYINTRGVGGLKPDLGGFADPRPMETATEQNIAFMSSLENGTYPVDSFMNETMLPSKSNEGTGMTTYSPFNETGQIDAGAVQTPTSLDANFNKNTGLIMEASETRGNAANTWEVYDSSHSESYINVNAETTTNAALNKMNANKVDLHDGTNTTSQQPDFIDYYYDYYTYSEIPANETSSKTKQTNGGSMPLRSDTANITNDHSLYPDIQTNGTMHWANETASVETSIGNNSNTVFDNNDAFYYDTVSESMPNLTYPEIETTTILFNGTMSNDTYIEMETTAVPRTIDGSTYGMSNMITATEVPLEVNYTTTQNIPLEITTAQTYTTNTFVERHFDRIPLDNSINPRAESPVPATQAPIVGNFYSANNLTIFNSALSSQNSTANITSEQWADSQLNQQIVVVPDALFDSVLFPVPNPDQDIVRVPDTITVFPTTPTETLDNIPTASGIKPTQNPVRGNSVGIDQQPRPKTDFVIDGVTTTPRIVTAKEMSQPISNIDYNVDQMTSTTSGQYVIDTTNFDMAVNPYEKYQPLNVTNDSSNSFSIDIPTQNMSKFFGASNNMLDVEGSTPPSLDPAPSVMIPVLAEGASVVPSQPFDAATVLIPPLLNGETETLYPTDAVLSKDIDYLPKSATDTSSIPTETAQTRKASHTSESQGLSEAEQLTLLKHTEDVIKAFVGRSNVPKGIKASTMRAVYPKTEIQTTPIIMLNRNNEAVSYLPDVGGNVDEIGGIPIQQGMFIDLFIPSFKSDPTTSTIELEKVTSEKVSSNVGTKVDGKAQMDLLIKGLGNRDALSGHLKSANTIVRNSNPNTGEISYATVPTFAFGKFSKASLPTTDSWILGAKRDFNKINRSNDIGAGSGQFSNFIPISSNEGSAKISVEKQPRLIMNSLKAPDVMPPIFVPNAKDNGPRQSNKNQFTSFGIDNMLAPPPIPAPNPDKLRATNTIWRGLGVNKAQKFGQMGSRTSNKWEKALKSNDLKGSNDFVGTSGPVYVPIHEISIPLKESSRVRSSSKPSFTSKQLPNYNVVNTTFSTLWDLNRLNRNTTGQSGTSLKKEKSAKQVIPPYIGIPLVWSGTTADVKTENKGSNNEQTWKDLPVPDVMPPIKVKLLNITSKGAFVDNKSTLTQTGDVNQRILKKLESIVGELQRNRELLTQTLDVNPAADQGVKLAFDKFPTQFPGSDVNSSKGTGGSWFGRQRKTLLSEVVQDPVSKRPISHGDTLSNNLPVISFQPYIHNDPRSDTSTPITTSSFEIRNNNFRLLNMLGISDLRPLESDTNQINIALNASDYNLGGEGSNNQTSINQTIIDTDALGNDTFMLLTNTLKALMTDRTITTPLSQIGSELSTLFSKSSPISTPSMPKASWFDSSDNSNLTGWRLNATSGMQSSAGSIWPNKEPSRQVVINATDLDFIQRSSAISNETVVTSSNQLVVLPTGSELLDPFAGTNISLVNDTNTGGVINQSDAQQPDVSTTMTMATGTSISMPYDKRTLNNTLATGQIVVSASATVKAIDELKQSKAIQRNMTSEEKRKDTLVRSNFNRRVKGFAPEPQPEISSLDNKYYVGGFNRNNILAKGRPNEIKVRTKPKAKNLPDAFAMTTAGIQFPVRVSSNTGLRKMPIDTKGFRQVSGHARTNFLLNSIPVGTNILNEIPINQQTVSNSNRLQVQNNDLNVMPNRGSSHVVSNKGFKRNTATRNRVQVLPINNLAVNTILAPSKNDAALNDDHVLLRNKPITNQLTFPRMQLSEFSVPPPANGEIITITEQPMETPVIREQLFNQVEKLYPNNNGFQLRNEKTVDMFNNPGGFGDTNILSKRVDVSIYPTARSTTKASMAYTDKYTNDGNGRFQNLHTSGALGASSMCPEGQIFICKAVGDYSTVPGMHWWCFSHCKKGDAFCPKQKCECTCELEQYETSLNSAPSSSSTGSRLRDRRVIQLTLNGSKEANVPLSTGRVDTINRNSASIKEANNLVITKYRSSDSFGQPTEEFREKSNIARETTPSLATSRSNIRGTVDNATKQLNLNCKGINAFAGNPEIDRWCTRMCNRNVCPSDLCLC